jgi:hypothetical protein
VRRNLQSDGGVKLLAFLVLLLLPTVALAEGRAVSSMPTPLSAPLSAEEEAGLADYERLITQTPAPVLEEAPRPRRPAVKVLQGSGEVKHGRSVENGVTVYRGLTPAR